MSFLYYDRIEIWVNAQQQTISHSRKEFLNQLDSSMISARVVMEKRNDNAFWKDCWCTDIKLAHLFPDLFLLTFSLDVYVQDYRLI